MCEMVVPANVNSRLIIQGSKQYVSHGGLIYNLIQELCVSRLTHRDCPFRVKNLHHAGGNQCHRHRTDASHCIKMIRPYRQPALLLPYPLLFSFSFITPKKTAVKLGSLHLLLPAILINLNMPQKVIRASENRHICFCVQMTDTALSKAGKI